MKRALLLLLIGCTVGSTAAYLYTYGDAFGSGTDRRTAARSMDSDGAIANRDPGAPGGTPQPELRNDLESLTSVSARRDVYLAAALLRDPEEVERAIELVMSGASSRARPIELEALLLRLVELDPAAAASAMRAVRAEPGLLESVFTAWASVDADAALAALGTIRDPGRLREIALALLDVLGYDARGLERVLPLISNQEHNAFRIDAIGRLARDDPYGAFVHALAIEDSSMQRSALTGVAAEWARRDPRAAVTLLDAIPEDALRRAFHDAVVTEWAHFDADSALTHVRETGWRVFAAPGNPAIEALAAVRPAELLALVDGLPAEDEAGAAAEDARLTIMRVALEALAARDARAAISYMDSLAERPEYGTLFRTVGLAYARQDPEAALEWARTLNPLLSSQAIAGVISSLARFDASRAVDAVLESYARGELDEAQLVGVSGPLAPSGRIGEILDRIYETQGDQRGFVLGRYALLVSWSTRDPGAAIDWAVRNAERLGSDGLVRIAERLASRDPEAAMAHALRIPEALRAEWVAAVAGRQAELAPQQALAMLAPLERWPGYADAVAAVAAGIADRDPSGAAQLLEGIRGPLPERAMRVVLVQVQRDPALAAEWVARFDDAQSRARAVSLVAQVWSQRRFEDARRWVLSLPREPARDRGLIALLNTSLQSADTLDSVLLDAFSSEAARQEGIVASVTLLAARDVVRARAIIAEHVSDPALRRQAEQMLSRYSGGRSAPFAQP